MPPMETYLLRKTSLESAFKITLFVEGRCWCCSLSNLGQQWGAIIWVLYTQVIQRYHGTCTST